MAPRLKGSWTHTSACHLSIRQRVPGLPKDTSHTWPRGLSTSTMSLPVAPSGQRRMQRWVEQVLGSAWQPHTSHLARHRNQVKLFSPSGVTVFSRLELCPLVRSCEAWQSHVQAGQSLLAFLKVGAPLSPPLPTAQV